MSITIKEVESKKEMKQFVKFFTKLYYDNKFVAFPLHFDEMKTLGEDNPALRFCQLKCWLAFKEGEIVGRIAAIINSKEQKATQINIGRFGLFDFIDDKSVSSALMKKATEWLKENGVATVHGPMGFTDMDRQGLLIEGYECPGTMATNYNFNYYQTHIEALAFKKSTDWIEFFLHTDDKSLQRIKKLSERCKKINNIKSIEFKSRKEVKKRAYEIFQLVNRSYSELYGFIELDDAQIEYYTEAYLSFVNLKMISVVVDQDDRIIGMGVSMPSFTKALQKAKGKLFPYGAIAMLQALRKNDLCDLYLIAIDKEYQGKGVNAIIMNDISNGAKELGINKAETNIELEDNTKVHQMWKFFKGEQHKRRRCYIKNLS
ncbi:GNAT family N-acetyltransferase [Halosquirtibacter xylanolyticus]|uniref:GNAT family N-acetyltransferase n=1 Tax=Halosquirtibacter xylanolyticus TaxID=3374599 RepID=UPI00374A7FC9|nr:GNAT family N-acetyltransferase [Prolixibacteraceae bacterium]